MSRPRQKHKRDFIRLLFYLGQYPNDFFLLGLNSHVRENEYKDVTVIILTIYLVLDFTLSLNFDIVRVSNILEGK